MGTGFQPSLVFMRLVSHGATPLAAFMDRETVAGVMFPVYLISGEPPTGLTMDIAVVGTWLLTIAVGEWVARGLHSPDHFGQSAL